MNVLLWRLFYYTMETFIPLKSFFFKLFLNFVLYHNVSSNTCYLIEVVFFSTTELHSVALAQERRLITSFIARIEC